MSRYAIWIDRDLAKVFEFPEQGAEENGLGIEACRTEARPILPLQTSAADREYFIRLASLLESASKILILGPGVAKHHFQTYLCEQNPLLAKRIVSCETLDRQTDAQLQRQTRELAAKFFQNRT